MTGLTYVIAGCIVMTYGPRQRRPKSRTSEPRTCAIGELRRTLRSGRATSAGMLHFSSAGVPLRAAGPAVKGTRCGKRIQIGVHGKAPTHFDSARAVVRICQKDVDQRSRDSSAASVPATRGRSWLSRSQPQRAVFSWNIVLIACRQTSSLRRYQLIVPDRRRAIGSSSTNNPTVEEVNNEQTRGDLCSCIIRPAEGAAHNRESDSGTDPVRWYLSFKLSSRDLVQMMSERGIALAHTTILRWVQRYVPEFEKRWNQYARPVGGSWRCDETYIKVGAAGRTCIEPWTSRAKRLTFY
jgi:hypothetical protein